MANVVWRMERGTEEDIGFRIEDFGFRRIRGRGSGVSSQVAAPEIRSPDLHFCNLSTSSLL